jgi:hypothetical protein
MLPGDSKEGAGRFENFSGMNNDTAWRKSLKDSCRIAMIDASEIVKKEAYNKGGTAHSDIYTPAIAQLIWDALESIPDDSLTDPSAQLSCPAIEQIFPKFSQICSS